MMSRATNPSLIVFVAGVIFPFGLMLSGPLIGYAMVVRTKVAKMGLALGISSLGMSLGGGIPVIITYLLDKHNWREVTVMLALVLFTVIVVPAIFLIPISICRNEGKQNERKRTPLNSKSQYLPLIFLGVAYLAPSLVSLSILQNLGAFAAEISLAPSDAAIIIAVGSLIAAGGQFVIGWALERVDRVLLYWAILIAMFVGLFILSRADHFQGLISGYCVVAILAAVMSPLMASFVRHYWGVVQFGSAMGALQAFGFCAGFGPLLVACLRDFFGGYHAAFLSLEIALFPAAFAFIAFLSSSRMLRISTESNTYFNDAVDRMAQGVADQP
jgi:MFS family permease